MAQSELLLHLDSAGQSNTADFTIGLNVPIRPEDDEILEVALHRVNYWYSWYNISASKGNNKFVYNDGTDDTTITIPDGNYSVSGLDAFIKSQMAANGDYDNSTNPTTYYISLSPNINTNRVYAKISGGYSIKFNDGTLYSLLGWNENDTVDSSGDAPNIADFTNGINDVLFRCDIVDGYSSIQNGVASDVLQNHYPTSAPSSHISFVPRQLIYLPVRVSYIDSIRMYITDQLGRPINLNGEPVSYLLSLRRVKKLVDF